MAELLGTACHVLGAANERPYALGRTSVIARAVAKQSFHPTEETIANQCTAIGTFGMFGKLVIVCLLLSNDNVLRHRRNAFREDVANRSVGTSNITYTMAMKHRIDRLALLQFALVVVGIL